MTDSSNRQNHVARSFSQQSRAIQHFIVDAVDFVLEQLETQATHDVPCIYPDQKIREQLASLLEPMETRFNLNSKVIADRFAGANLQRLMEACRQDFQRYPLQDPALSNIEEVFFASNGFWATVAYRIAHSLRQLGVPVIPRAISGFAHSRTGVDIHPGATIGPGLFIDHGTGIAIGCTAVLEENVSLYNGVVLGTKSKPAKETNQETDAVQKRHPTIKSGVSLYTNAFVGGDVTVGENAIIGAYAFVTNDVPAGAAVKGKSDASRQSSELNRDFQRLRGSSSEDQPIHASKSPVLARKATIQRSANRRPAVLSLIGNTPMIEIRNLHDNPNVQIFAKLEGSNPTGSVKDRIALSLIEQAEASGELRPGKIILESTSGNTGIGLAMVGAAKGYQVVLTMSSAMSEERKKVARAFGATLIETDPTQGTGGAIQVARQMAADNPGKYWVANQHASLDNPLVHYESTADEILKQVPDVTHFVAGIGTFGTLRGAGGRLREAVGAKVIGIEPVLGQSIQGLRNMNEPNAPKLYDESLLDEKKMAMADSAYAMTRLLAEKEGLLVGMSSGAAMQGAIELAETLNKGVIVVLFPDRGEKYLSTPLFDVPVATPAELESNTDSHDVVPFDDGSEDFVGDNETFVGDAEETAEWLFQI